MEALQSAQWWTEEAARSWHLTAHGHERRADSARGAEDRAADDTEAVDDAMATDGRPRCSAATRALC